jgi:transposase InsO family protein
LTGTVAIYWPGGYPIAWRPVFVRRRLRKHFGKANRKSLIPIKAVSLESNGIKVSMDSAGRYLDNIFVERFWRTLKYEEVYLKAYRDNREARIEIGEYIRFYNAERPHQSLGYKTPAEEHYAEPIEVVKEHVLQSETTTVSISNPVRIAGLHLNLE